MIRKGQGHNQTSVGDMINPVNGHRGMLKKKGIVPRDHMKENRKALREFQQLNRDILAEKEPESENLYKLSQFQNVASRVYQEPTKEPYRQSDGQFLRKGKDLSRQEEIMTEARIRRAKMERALREDSEANSDSPPSPRKAPVYKEVQQCAPKSNKNFIRQNKVESVMNFNNRKSESSLSQKTASLPRHDEYGRVPAYLEDRKAQWREEEEYRRANAPDPNCPKGMTVMPESERLETLEVLQNSRAEAMKQLSALPFVVETPSLRRKHESLEAKIKEIDSAIALFSRQKVYISKD